MKNIIIFGATGAIGQALSRQLTTQGADVFLAGRDEGQLQALSQEIGARYGVCDAFDEASVADVITTAQEKGPLTGLVWAIGSILLKPVGKLTGDDFQNSFYLNVTAAGLAIKHASQSLKEGQGSVLLFSSVAARQGFTAHGAIAAAKAGVEGMAIALATELAPDIRINVIAPSLSQSKMAAPLLSNEMMAKGIAQAHPLRRLGTGDDFAPLAAMLMDNERSGWITGAVLPVDGGACVPAHKGIASIIMTQPKHIFITGVSAGIGKALVEALCKQGHKVSGVARRQDKLETLAEMYEGFQGFVCDVSDKDAVSKAISSARAGFGPIDVLIPNAGIYVPDTAATIDVASFEAHMQVNYMASIYCLADILPEMMTRRTGHIALMASVAGYRGLPRSLAYGPTKAALINLGESLRFDLANTGVKIQIICPGFVETEATSVNDFVMPDIITADEAAREIIKGLASNKFEIAFPRNFARKMKWLKYLSNDMYYSLVAKATGKR